jgi:hypothetical protein
LLGVAVCSAVNTDEVAVRDRAGWRREQFAASGALRAASYDIKKFLAQEVTDIALSKRPTGDGADRAVTA